MMTMMRTKMRKIRFIIDKRTSMLRAITVVSFVLPPYDIFEHFNVHKTE